MVKVNCFWKGFLTSRNAPALSLSRIFLMGHFPRSKIISKSSFLIKCCINTVINYFWERFGQYWKSKKKMDFPLYFQKWIFGWCRVFFSHMSTKTWGKKVHIIALKSPRGRLGVVGYITQLWPNPTCFFICHHQKVLLEKFSLTSEKGILWPFKKKGTSMVGAYFWPFIYRPLQ